MVSSRVNVVLPTLCTILSFQTFQNFQDKFLFWDRPQTGRPSLVFFWDPFELATSEPFRTPSILRLVLSLSWCDQHHIEYNIALVYVVPRPKPTQAFPNREKIFLIHSEMLVLDLIVLLYKAQKAGIYFCWQRGPEQPIDKYVGIYIHGLNHMLLQRIEAIFQSKDILIKVVFVYISVPNKLSA